MLNTIVVITLFMLAIAFVISIGLAVTKRIRHSNYVSSAHYGQLVQLLQDKHELHRFGFGQYLKRQYGEFSAFHLSFLNMGMLTMTMLLLGYLMYYVSMGTALGLFLLIGIGYMITASVNAQLISSQPTSGGLFHVALRRSGAVLASIVGALKLLAQLATIIIYSYATTYLIDLFINYPNSNQWSKLIFFIVMSIVIATQVLFASLKSALTRWIQGIGMLVVWLTIIVLVILLTTYLFFQGYSPIHMLFSEQSIVMTVQELNVSSIALVILIFAKWFVGHDEASAAAEETVEPKLKTAWAIFLANSYTLIIGFVVLVVASCFYMNIKLQAGMESPISWLFQLMDIIGTLQYPFLLLCIIVSWYSGMITVVNSSRLLMAVARDKMVPFHKKLSMISLARQTPHNALIAVGILAIMFLSLLYLLDDSLVLFQLLYVIIATYSFSYMLVHYFCNTSEKEVTNWSLAKAYPIFRMLSIFFQLILFSLAIYFLSWEISLLLGIVVIVVTIYIGIRLGNAKLQLQATGKQQDFELERNLPLQ